MIDHLLGDLVDRLLPADALPLAGAPLTHPLQGHGEPARPVHQLGVAGPLLAAAGVEVGHTRLGRRVGRGLLLANHDAVLYVEVPLAGAAAVRPAVGSLGDAVPGPALAVEVLPAAELLGSAGGAGLEGDRARLRWKWKRGSPPAARAAAPESFRNWRRVGERPGSPSRCAMGSCSLVRGVHSRPESRRGGGLASRDPIGKRLLVRINKRLFIRQANEEISTNACNP